MNSDYEFFSNPTLNMIWVDYVIPIMSTAIWLCVLFWFCTFLVKKGIQFLDYIKNHKKEK